VAKGVPAAILGPLCTQWIAIRTAHMFAYLVGVNDVISTIRMTLFYGGLFTCLKIVNEAIKVK